MVIAKVDYLAENLDKMTDEKMVVMSVVGSGIHLVG